MGLLTKLIMFYAIMSLCITLYDPQTVFGSDYNSTVLSFFNINGYNSTTGEININQGTTLGNDLGQQFTINVTSDQQTIFAKIVNGISGTINYFVDGLANVLEFFKIVFKVIASPIIFLFSPAAAGMPKIIGAFIGLPMVLLMLFAIVAFIRGLANP